jgi:Protein of unknown function (DUF3592)
MSSAYSRLWAYGIRYGLYFAFAWGAVYFRRWQKRRREMIAQGWPSVEGVIVSSQVTPIPKTTRFHATLQYTYFVDEYRTGKYVHEFQREVDADEFVRQLKDKRLQIRYKQSNPDKSVLEQSVVEQHVLLAPRFG